MVYIGVISGLFYFLILGHIFILLCLPSLFQKLCHLGLHRLLISPSPLRVTGRFCLGSPCLHYCQGSLVGQLAGTLLRFTLYIFPFSGLTVLHSLCPISESETIVLYTYYTYHEYIYMYLYIFLVLCCFLVTPFWFEEEFFQMSFYIIWKTVLWTSTYVCLQHFHLHFSLWLHWCQVELTWSVSECPVPDQTQVRYSLSSLLSPLSLFLSLPLSIWIFRFLPPPPHHACCMADTSQEAHLEVFCSTSPPGVAVDLELHLSEARLPGHLLLSKLPEPRIQQVSPRGRESELWTRRSAGRIVSSVGTIAAHPTLANPTGMAGTEAGEALSPAGVICHPFSHSFPTRLNCVRRFGAIP